MIYIRLYKLCGTFQVEALQGSRVNAQCSVQCVKGYLYCTLVLHEPPNQP